MDRRIQRSGQGMMRRLVMLLGSAALLLPLAEPLGQRSGAVARTLLAMAATATATPAQAQAQETEIWSATLTVGQHATFGNLKGFFGGGTIGALSDTGFDLDGTSVTVKIVQVNNDDGNLRFGLTTNFPDNSRSKLILQVGDDRFPFPVGSSDDLDLTDWSNSGLTWTTGDTIAIKLIQSEVTDPPTVTSITRQTPAASSTNADSLTWRVVFSQSVTNVDSADFVVDGTTATLSVAEVTGQTGAWDVTASGGDLAGLNGTVTLSFAPTQYIVGSLFALSNTTPAGTNENSYEVDNTAPTLSYTPPRSMTVGRAITASPRTTDTDIASYSATGLPSGLTINPTTGVISGTVATARSTITNVTVTVTDNAGNTVDVPLEFPSVQDVDVITPTVTSITRLLPATSPTNADSLTWRVIFSEEVTNVDSTDFVVSGTTATLSVAPVTDQTGGYDVTASGGNLAGLNGTVTLSLASSPDIADVTTSTPNLLVSTTPAVTNESSYELDNTAPTVSYPAPPTSLVVGASIRLMPDTTDTDIAQYSATNLPSGLMIDEMTGVISGMLDRSSVSTSIVMVTVTDTVGNTVDVTVTFPVVQERSLNAPTVTRAVLEITPGTPGTTPTQAEIDAYKNDPDNAVILAAIPDDDEDEYVTGILSNPATSDRVRKIDLYLSESITSTASGFPEFVSSGNLVDAFTITVNDVESTSSIHIVYDEDDLKITIFPSGSTIGVDGKVEIGYSRATAGTEALQGATGNVDDFTQVLRDDPAATPTATTVDYTLPATLEVGRPIRLVPTTTGSHNIGRFTLPNVNEQTPSWLTINQDNGVISGTPDTTDAAFIVEVRVFSQTGNPIDMNGADPGNDLRLRFPGILLGEIPSLENRPPTVESAELKSEDTQILVIFSETTRRTTGLDANNIGDCDEIGRQDVVVDGVTLGSTLVCDNSGIDQETVTLGDAFTIMVDDQQQDIRSVSQVGSSDRLTVVLSSPIPTDATNVILIYDPSALGVDSDGNPRGLEDTNGNLVEAFRRAVRGVDDSTAPTVSYTALPDSLVVGTAITPIEPTIQNTDIASYTATGLPPGLMIAEDTGIITGTPSQMRRFPSIVTVTVTDNASNEATVMLDLPVVQNPPGVRVTPTNLNPTEGDMDTYVVALDSEPAGDVTITAMTSGDSGAVSISPPSLTFTTTNWDTAQTVTVTGVQDADAIDETVTISHSVSGYGDLTTAAAVMVSVTDDEAPRVRVEPTDLGTIMEPETTAYTLVLEIQPSGTVTITPSSSDTDAVSLSPASLTFTTFNWDTAQTVNVTAVDDSNTTDERVTISHMVSGYGAVTSAEAVTISITDDDEDPGVRVEPSPRLSTLEGLGRNYTVTLITQPTGPVTITPSSSDTDALSLSPPSLTFTTTNWDTAQMVSVVGVDDVDNNNETVTVSHSVSGYGPVTAAPELTVRVTDNEQAFPTTRVCDRTPEVAAAIVQRLAGVTTCDEVSEADLNGITRELNVNSLNSLQVGDFADLTSLQGLDLNGSLSSLPTGIFSDLTALTQLYLNNNNLSSLDANIFADLSNLEDLHLHENSLSSLPSGIFNNLSTLREIWLQDNSLTSLPDGIFNGLSNLDRVLLDNNSLTSLPAGIFNGLSGLDTLHLNDNSLSSLPDGIFDALSNLDNLRLVNNGLECFPATDHTALWGRVAADDLALDLPDCFEVSLSVTPTEVEEGNGGESITVTATLSAARVSSRATEVVISVVNGTATEGTDFAAVNDFTITIPADSTSATGTFTLAAGADTEVETAGETVLVNGTATDLSYSANVDGAMVTIQDNPDNTGEPMMPGTGDPTTPSPTPNPPTVTLSRSTQAVTEEGGSLTFTLTLDEPASSNLTVDVTIAETEDMVAATNEGSRQVTVAQGRTQATFTVATENDDVDEADSVVTATVVADSADPATYQVGSAATATATVMDNDTAGETKAQKEAKAVLDEVVLPDVLQQVTARTTEVITSRFNSIASGSPSVPTVTLSLDDVVADTVAFFHGERDQLKNGSLDWQQALAGRSFALPLSTLNLAQGQEGVMSDEESSSTLVLWGGGNYTGYGNTIQGTQVDGDGFSGTVGIDLQPMPRLVTGLALTTSRWGLDYNTSTDGTIEAGTYEIGITTVNPYLNWLATDQLSFWATFGYGRGEVEQTPDGEDATPAPQTQTDDLTSWAGGLRFEVIPAAAAITGEGSPFALAFKVDGAASSFLDADVQLARLAAEVSRSFTAETGLVTAALELGWNVRSVSDQDDLNGLRQAIADENSSGGAELAGRLHWLSIDGSVSATVDTRVLLGGDDRSEWGIGGQLRVIPSKRDGEGLSLSLQPSFGVTGTKLDELWSLSGDGDLAINNNQPGARLDAKLAYGFPLGNALLTPYTEVTWADATSTYGAGLRYGLNPLLELDLKGSRRSRANGHDENHLLLELRSHL